MARQKGVIKLEGAVGDITFYKTKNGYMVREKTGVSAERVKLDPAFQRTRENNSEFGRAGKASKLLRNAINLLLQYASDGRVTSRLTVEMLRVIQSDQVNARGDRTMLDGEIGFLQGFEFNNNGKLKASLYAPFTPSIDRAGGTCTVEFPDFIPEVAITYPEGATHFKLVIGAAEVDFAEEAFQFATEETGALPLDHNPTGVLNLSAALTAGTSMDMFLILGIDFMQEVNGTMYPLKTGANNPLSIVAIDRA